MPGTLGPAANSSQKMPATWCSTIRRRPPDGTCAAAHCERPPRGTAGYRQSRLDRGLTG